MKKSKIFWIVLLFGIFLVSESEAWWDDSWSCRKKIVVNNLNDLILEDFQIGLNISYETGMNNNFNDIRFTWLNESNSEEIEIPYWIESKVDGSWAFVWTKIKKIEANANSTMYLYFCNENATSQSNGTNVFEFFDDFSSDLSKWTQSVGSWTISNGKLKTVSGSNRLIIYATGKYFSTGIIEAELGTSVSSVSNDLGIYFRGNGYFNSLDTARKFVWSIAYNRWDNDYFTSSAENPEGTSVKVKVVMGTGSNIKYYVNGNLLMSDGSSQSQGTNPGFVGLTSWEHFADNWWDNFRVRKYAPNEPTYTIYATERFRLVYYEDIFETQKNIIILNLSDNSEISSLNSATLNYSNQIYQGNILNKTATWLIEAPEVNQIQNLTFYITYSITYTNGSSKIITTNGIQTIWDVESAFYSTTTPSTAFINITTFNEKNPSQLVNSTKTILLKITPQNSTHVFLKSFLFDNLNTAHYIQYKYNVYPDKEHMKELNILLTSSASNLNEGYKLRTTTFEFTFRRNESKLLKQYLLNYNAYYYTFTIKDRQTNYVIPNAKMIVKRAGFDEIIQQIYSSVDGTILTVLELSFPYQIHVEKEGYDSVDFEYVPSGISEITIYMSPSGTSQQVINFILQNLRHSTAFNGTHYTFSWQGPGDIQFGQVVCYKIHKNMYVLNATQSLNASSGSITIEGFESGNVYICKNYIFAGVMMYISQKNIDLREKLVFGDFGLFILILVLIAVAGIFAYEPRFGMMAVVVSLIFMQFIGIFNIDLSLLIVVALIISIIMAMK